MELFDYKGYTEEKLLELCSSKNLNVGKAEHIFWTSETYSFGEHYRNYCNFPKKLSLNIYSDHGIGNSTVYKHELKNNAPAIFLFSEKKMKNYKELSNKPCYLVLPPLISYRRKSRIKKSPNAKGTLAFPIHSTPSIDINFNIDSYIEKLKKLPEDMQPVCVSLHMHDINKGLHKKFIENNIPVYCAGNVADIKFGERFYNILKHFKYACSNAIGTYTYYALDLDIPFSLVKENFELNNISDNNFEKGLINCRTEEFKNIQELFKDGIYRKITKEQKELLAQMTGGDKEISPTKMKIILYRALLKHKDGLKQIIKSLLRFKI